MFNKKIVISAVVTSFLVSSLYAKNDELEEMKKDSNKTYVDYEKNHTEKSVKQKELPKGLEKKVAKDGTLPTGWQKKLAKGQVADSRILERGTMINSKNYPYVKNTDIYRVEDKVFRIAQGTHMILEVFQ